MVDMLLRREGHALVPDTEADVAQFSKLRDGHSYFGKIVFKRSVQHHRWWRGLVWIVSQGIGVNHETLHDDIKYKAQLVRAIMLGQASRAPYVLLKSTAFDQMDEGTFIEFVTVGVEIIFRDYLPDVPRSNVFERVRQMVGHDRPTD